MTLRELLEEHFEKVMELGVLVFIFVFAAMMLALFPMREEMSRWIENGAVIAILARAFGTVPAEVIKATVRNGVKDGKKE